MPGSIKSESEWVFETSRWPSPIANAYSAMLEAETPQAQFRSAIRLFSSTLRYIALILLSDHLRLRDQHPVLSVDDLVVKQLTRPSLGQWNQLIREILTGYCDDRESLFAPELLDFYFCVGAEGKPVPRKKGKPIPRKTVEAIDGLIRQRNLWVHPDLDLPDREAKEEYATARKALDIVFSELRALCDYPLVLVWEKVQIQEPCMGVRFHDSYDSASGAVFILRHGWESGARELSLGSFLYCGNRTEGDHKRVLLYETKLGKKIRYTVGNDYAIADDKPLPGATISAKGRLEDIIAQLSTDLHRQLEGSDVGENIYAVAPHSTIKWTQFRQVLQRVSEETKGAFVSERKMDFGCYVERPKPCLDVEAFIGSDRRILVMVADSGLGKTNLFCRLNERLNGSGHAVLFLYARTCPVEPIDRLIYEQLCSRTLIPEDQLAEFGDMLAAVGDCDEIGAGHAKFVLLLDALNESLDPEEEFGHVMEFVKGYSYPWLRVILNVRTFVWNKLQHQATEARSVFFGTEASVGCIPSITLDPFSKAEVEEAYQIYGRKFGIRTPYDLLSAQSQTLLRNPLLMRFVCETYQNGDIPQSIITESTFERYLKDRIDKRDRGLLDVLGLAMWQLQRDFVLFEDVGAESAHGPTGSAVMLLDEESPTDKVMEKLRDYLFADPVYEMSLLLECPAVGCERYKKPVSAEGTVDLASARQRQCEVCHSQLRFIEEDNRTSYVRLLSENIIHEYPEKDDLAVRFTYDRWFEFVLGRILLQRVPLESPEKAAAKIRHVLTEVQYKFVFWGVFRSVLLSLLRGDKWTPELWQRFLAGFYATSDQQSESGDGDGMFRSMQVSGAFDQIFACTLQEFANENRRTVELLMDRLSGEANGADYEMRIALETSARLLLTAEHHVDVQSVEMDVVRRGLAYRLPSVRSKAAQAVLAMTEREAEAACGLLEEYHRRVLDTLLFPQILKLSIPNRAKRFWNELDSFSSLLLYLIGRQYSDTKVRRRFVMIGLQTIDSFQAHAVVNLIEPILVKLLAHKLCQVYWGNSNPCNYMEMAQWLKIRNVSVTDRLGDLFLADTGRLPAELELFDLCQVENGLISWYLYSIIPTLLQRSGYQDSSLKLLLDIFRNGNSMAKYTVMHALWVAIEFGGVRQDQVGRALETTAVGMLRTGEHQFSLHHDCACDSEVRRYVTERTPDGAKRAFWASYESGKLIVKYDNAALAMYSDYRIHCCDAVRLDLVVEMFHDERRRHNHEWIARTLRSLGVIGMRHPLPVLNTIQELLDGPFPFEAPIDCFGRTEVLRELLVESLSKIKGFFPHAVDHFIEQLGQRNRQELKSVLMSRPEPAVDDLNSYYGQVVYQKAFLDSPEVRRIFGNCVKQSGRTDSVQKFFAVYIRGYLSGLRSRPFISGEGV